MKILAVGGPKGGVGKTTTAVTLSAVAARAGLAVLLVDADRNRSAEEWAGATGDNLPVDLATADSPEELSRLRTATGFDLVVVDLPGAREGGFEIMLRGAEGEPVPDLLVTPSSPETMDLRPTLRVLRGEVAPLGLDYRLTLTRVPHYALPRARQSLDMLAAAGVLVARTLIRQYSAYPDALDQDSTVLDLPGRSAERARADYRDLAAELFTAVGLDVDTAALEGIV